MHVIMHGCCLSDNEVVLVGQALGILLPFAADSGCLMYGRWNQSSCVIWKHNTSCWYLSQLVCPSFSHLCQGQCEGLSQCMYPCSVSACGSILVRGSFKGSAQASLEGVIARMRAYDGLNVVCSAGKQHKLHATQPWIFFVAYHYVAHTRAPCCFQLVWGMLVAHMSFFAVRVA